MNKAIDSGENPGFLRHPLLVLFVATLLGSVLIPFFNSRSDRERLLREARLKKSTEILEHYTTTLQQLNGLVTILELFHKDNSGPAARLVEYKKEQKELRRTMNERYLEFDKDAWWWYNRLDEEAEHLGITSPTELTRIKEIGAQYDDNLVQSVGVMNELWSAFLRETYRPSDPKNKQLMEQTRTQLHTLRLGRSKLVLELSQKFAAQ